MQSLLEASLVTGPFQPLPNQPPVRSGPIHLLGWELAFVTACLPVV